MSPDPLLAGGAGHETISSPDQIFRARPAALSKNRVWTRSPVKLGLNRTSISARCRTNQIAQVK